RARRASPDRASLPPRRSSDLAISIMYIADDPFTRDWRDLQSSTEEIRGVRAIDTKIKMAFDAGGMLSGQAYQVAIAVEDRDQVRSEEHTSELQSREKLVCRLL